MTPSSPRPDVRITLFADRHSTNPASNALGTSRYTWMWAEDRMPDLTASSPSSPAAKWTCRRDMRFRPPALMLAQCEWYVPCTQMGSVAASVTRVIMASSSSAAAVAPEWPWFARMSRSPVASSTPKLNRCFGHFATMSSSIAIGTPLSFAWARTCATGAKPSARTDSPHSAAWWRSIHDRVFETRVRSRSSGVSSVMRGLLDAFPPPLGPELLSAWALPPAAAPPRRQPP